MILNAIHIAGASHREAGKACQDRSRCFGRCFGGRRAAVVLVSDGHGHPAHFRSERGAAFALDAAAEALAGLMESIGDYVGVTLRAGAGESCGDAHADAVMRAFFADIMQRWYAKVLNDYAIDPPREVTLAPPVRAYGCTLVGAVLCSGLRIAFQLGDGACAELDALGHPRIPLPDDPRCRGALTTSMCSDGADDFRFVVGPDVPRLIMVCSDGLVNSFGSESGLAGELLPELAADLADKGAEAVACELVRILPGISECGSRDDISLAYCTL